MLLYEKKLLNTLFYKRKKKEKKLKSRTDKAPAKSTSICTRELTLNITLADIIYANRTTYKDTNRDVPAEV